MVTLVLLPGMDGTGDLFSPFLAEYADRTKVVRYPTDEALGYGELENVARAELPLDEPFVLLGESFSGPIAISIAATPPRNLIGIILCCTFAKNPRPVLGPLRSMVGFLPSKPPLKLVEALLCGAFATPGLRESLKRALAQVSPASFRARLQAVAGVNVVKQLQGVEMPILYLRASEDRVVPHSASALVMSKGPHVRLVELAAPHFLLQSVPREAAKAIREFIEEARLNAL